MREPTVDWVRKARVELTVLGELCEAWRLADAVQILSFAWDESCKFQTDLMSTNIQVIAGKLSGVKAGSELDIIGRGSFVIPGGTAEQVQPSTDHNNPSHTSPSPHPFIANRR